VHELSTSLRKAGHVVEDGAPFWSICADEERRTFGDSIRDAFHVSGEERFQTHAVEGDLHAQIVGVTPCLDVIKRSRKPDSWIKPLSRRSRVSISGITVFSFR
jgi:hypothetical protein